MQDVRPRVRPDVQPSHPILTGYPLFDAILNEDALCNLILDSCSAKGLVLLLRTSHAIRGIVFNYMKRTFDVDKLLSRYFTYPLSFRQLQACTGTLISGSTALQFFDRTFYPESDLDIYVPRAWRSEVGRFLLQAGYKFVRHPPQHPTFINAVFEHGVSTATANYGNFKGISGVFNFEKDGRHGEKLKIQLMVAVRSAIEPILHYHSSQSFTIDVMHVNLPQDLATVMNVIAFDTAYCLYPHATLEERLSLACTVRQDRTLEGIWRKYMGRGWRIVHRVDHLESRTSDVALHRRRTRWINDGLSWSIKLPVPPGFENSLPPLNRRTEALCRDPVSITTWKLTVCEGSRTGKTVFIHRQSVNMFYTYVFANEEPFRAASVRNLLEFASLANAGCHSNALYARH